jgi:hypothetical protein
MQNTKKIRPVHPRTVVAGVIGAGIQPRRNRCQAQAQNAMAMSERAGPIERRHAVAGRADRKRVERPEAVHGELEERPGDGDTFTIRPWGGL